MCFVKRKGLNSPLCAETDIEVYKVFRKISYFREPDYYTGPYQTDFVYHDMNGEYECEDFGEVKESGYTGFHSYKNFNDAVKFMDEKGLWANDHETFEVVPCFIPKGSLYYDGFFLGSEAYVSEKIKLDY